MNRPKFPILQDFSHDDNMLLMSALETGNIEDYNFGYFNQRGPPQQQSYNQIGFPQMPVHHTFNRGPPSRLTQETEIPTRLNFPVPQPQYSPPQHIQSEPQVNQHSGKTSHNLSYYQKLQQMCSKLEEENKRIKMENQILRKQNTKPAPLYRSFSKEIRDTERELDNVVARISLESKKRNNEDNLRNLLEIFREHLKRRQQVQSEETQQFAHPKLQERLTLLGGTAPSNRMLLFDIRNLSQDQIDEMNQIKQENMAELEDIFIDRGNILSDIKDYYTEKIMGENVIHQSSIIESKDIDKDVVLILSNKIDSLKRNIQKESKTLYTNLERISNVLSPIQEAHLVMEYYRANQENFSLYNLLYNIWDLFSDNV